MTPTHHGNGRRVQVEPDVGLAGASPHQPVSQAGRDRARPDARWGRPKSKREPRGLDNRPANQQPVANHHRRSRRSPRQSCRRSRRQPPDAIKGSPLGRLGKRTRAPGVARITPEPDECSVANAIVRQERSLRGKQSRRPQPFLLRNESITVCDALAAAANRIQKIEGETASPYARPENPLLRETAAGPAGAATTTGRPRGRLGSDRAAERMR